VDAGTFALARHRCRLTRTVRSNAAQHKPGVDEVNVDAPLVAADAPRFRSREERDIFCMYVNDRRFARNTLPLLVQLVRHIASADRIAGQIEQVCRRAQALD
jgi:hypothetical protein